ncbi:MAG: Lrp/AsnC family transcriptional regulator [Chloroflexota bacterium]
MDDQLDEMDRRIIHELRRNGRQANTEMARTMGVSETMVRHRIRKLVDRGVIQVAARVNLSRLGNDIHVVISIVCDGRAGVPDVAREVAAIPEVRYVSVVTGQCDLLVMASFRSSEELFTFLVEQLKKIPGVARTETLHQLRVIKRDYDYWDAR